MQLPRPCAVQFAATHRLVPDTPAIAGPSAPASRWKGLLDYVMNAPSFLKRLVRSVVNPSERRRAEKRAQAAIELCHALISERGEVSGAVLARDALAAYNALSDAAQPPFFDRLVAEFAPDRAELEAAYAVYHAQPTQENLVRLQRCVEAPRQEL